MTSENEARLTLVEHEVEDLRRDHDGLHEVIHGNGEPGLKGRLDRAERILIIVSWFAVLITGAALTSFINSLMGKVIWK